MQTSAFFFQHMILHQWLAAWFSNISTLVAARTQPFAADSSSSNVLSELPWDAQVYCQLQPLHHRCIPNPSSWLQDHESTHVIHHDFHASYICNLAEIPAHDTKFQERYLPRSLVITRRQDFACLRYDAIDLFQLVREFVTRDLQQTFCTVLNHFSDTRSQFHCQSRNRTQSSRYSIHCGQVDQVLLQLPPRTARVAVLWSVKLVEIVTEQAFSITVTMHTIYHVSRSALAHPISTGGAWPLETIICLEIQLV